VRSRYNDTRTPPLKQLTWLQIERLARRGETDRMNETSRNGSRSVRAAAISGSVPRRGFASIPCMQEKLVRVIRVEDGFDDQTRQNHTESLNTRDSVSLSAAVRHGSSWKHLKGAESGPMPTRFFCEIEVWGVGLTIASSRLLGVKPYNCA